ncbi:ribosomal L1 domain-containing protein CG13096 [Phlebotomus argentipes]|uniref:ribosomal L1 domain-containing protein CG13096 n=1 Tax=Phlebotomus argentipes TaxID=94469 RepID=UPI002892C1DC|nr:ribosomal L1 domain-containing protein CG13096 [Phlebotomus argentipes]
MTERKRGKKESKEDASDEVLVARETILKAVEGMQKCLQEKQKSKKSMLDVDFKYSLQVGVFKIPKGDGKLSKVLLPHSLINDTDEVCLFVKDLRRGTKIDYEPTKEHFEEVLRVAGVSRINRVIPINELKKEYGPYEAKLKLAQSFDVFLADSRIYNRVMPLVGKHFLKRKKLPIALKMDCEDLEESVAKALRFTIYRQSNAGNVMSIDVGKHSMSKEAITDNIVALVEQLKTQLPGGWENIKSIYVKPAKDEPLSIPLYLNAGTGVDVAVPEVISQKEAVLAKKRKHLEDTLDAVSFTQDGKLTSVGKRAKVKA